MLTKKIKCVSNKSAGFTLVEVVVSIGIFAILCAFTYGLYASIIRGVSLYRGQTTISALADQYLEIARNLPYSEIGTQNGNPHGSLPDEPNPTNITFNGNDYQIYYVVNALHDIADSNPTIQDYKQVKLYVKNLTTNTTNSFVTTIAPISLSQMASGGGLLIQVIDQTWQPVSGAIINILNTDIEPNINLTRTSDSTGKWSEIGLLPDSNYQISVTKANHSIDHTYPVSTYPDTLAPHATVIDGQITQKTFIIDELSNLSLLAQSQICQPISGIDIGVSGAKLISPGLPKFNESYTTNGSGLAYPYTTTSCSNTCGADNCCLEWDTYTPTLNSEDYMIYGTSPIQEVNVLPNTSQNFSLILGPKTENGLLAVVTDSATGNPIEGAPVILENTFLEPVFSQTKYTSGSVWSQQYWYGGSGQSTFTDETKYFEDDGHISADVIPLALRLAKDENEDYYLSGYLVSSTFDTGTSLTSYSTLTWQQNFPDPEISIAFQIATSNTNDENTVWEFIGPGGTSNSSDVYNVSGSTINSTNNNKRYVRYKVYLSTSNAEKTPSLSSISVNYVSGCPTPGQAMFANLELDDHYTATVNATGYESQTFENINIDGYFILQASLTSS